jgi:hypothetical protein
VRWEDEFSAEFKLEAVKLVRDRGVAVREAARDLDVHENGADLCHPDRTQVVEGTLSFLTVPISSYYFGALAPISMSSHARPVNA